MTLHRSYLRPALAGAALALTLQHAAAADVIPVTEDVMTSSFFQGPNKVRGYAAESTRAVMRVSTGNPQGTTGAETIYLSFSQDFSVYSGPVVATLTLQSTEGGFGLDAGAATPFVVSAHAVSANPLASITDDTNPGGTISWLDFYNHNILAASSAARTAVTGVGTVTFDVSDIVNGWIAGANSHQFIALTGKNDASGNDFLQGFVNNDNGGTALGVTFLTVSAVPEPGSYALLLAGLGLVGWAARRRTATRA